LAEISIKLILYACYACNYWADLYCSGNELEEVSGEHDEVTSAAMEQTGDAEDGPVQVHLCLEQLDHIIVHCAVCHVRAPGL